MKHALRGPTYRRLGQDGIQPVGLIMVCEECGNREVGWAYANAGGVWWVTHVVPLADPASRERVARIEAGEATEDDQRWLKTPRGAEIHRSIIDSGPAFRALKMHGRKIKPQLVKEPLWDGPARAHCSKHQDLETREVVTRASITRTSTKVVPGSVLPKS